MATTATTTVPAVKAALYDLLKARPGLAGVQVEWARPSHDAMQPEAVWFEGTKTKQRAQAMGHQRRDETYILELTVSIVLDGDEARACEYRMWQVVADIEACVRENPRPIPAPLFDVQFDGADQQPAQAPGQRLSEATVRIAARSRI
ncbi:MAG: hypothetical protein Q8O56_13905 [Solirubrobacteraceae bacterium]|nr:hypothetical protein [Solirubrobacteraceae bacterium]